MHDQPALGVVLVVDDDENVRRLLDIKLQRAGAAVAVAEDGAGALASAGAARPDLVVLADSIADMDACDVIRSLAALDRRPGIVVLSGRRAATSIRAALECGADDYVLKPFSPQELIHRLVVVGLRRATGERVRA